MSEKKNRKNVLARAVVLIVKPVKMLSEKTVKMKKRVGSVKKLSGEKKKFVAKKVKKRPDKDKMLKENKNSQN